MPQLQPINPVVGPMPTFIGSIVNEARNDKEPLESGWHINLQSGDEKLTWCVDTGAQVSVIPKSAYKPKNGKLSATDRDILGAKVAAKDSWICGDALKTWPKVSKKEKVYFVRGTPKLLLHGHFRYLSFGTHP